MKHKPWEYIFKSKENRDHEDFADAMSKGYKVQLIIASSDPASLQKKKRLRFVDIIPNPWVMALICIVCFIVLDYFLGSFKWIHLLFYPLALVSFLIPILAVSYFIITRFINLYPHEEEFLSVCILLTGIVSVFAVLPI